MPEPEGLKRWKLDRIRRAETHIMGRVTYEQMAGYWPTSTDDYAAPMNEIPKTVFSKKLDEAAWAGSSVARGDLTDEIEALRRQPGGEIIAWGGANFAQSLSRARLVDEYVLVIKPVALGSGLPLFADLPGALRLDLIEAKTLRQHGAPHLPAERSLVSRVDRGGRGQQHSQLWHTYAIGGHGKANVVLPPRWSVGGGIFIRWWGGSVLIRSAAAGRIRPGCLAGRVRCRVCR
jgi:dihydrofolate reductase